MVTAGSCIAARRAEFKEPEEAADDNARLEGAEEDVAALEAEARVRRYSMEMPVATLDTFDARLPVHEVYMLLHLRIIFDFRRMPRGDDEALQTWSNESIA